MYKASVLMLKVIFLHSSSFFNIPVKTMLLHLCYYSTGKFHLYTNSLPIKVLVSTAGQFKKAEEYKYKFCHRNSPLYKRPHIKSCYITCSVFFIFVFVTSCCVETLRLDIQFLERSENIFKSHISKRHTLLIILCCTDHPREQHANSKGRFPGNSKKDPSLCSSSELMFCN